MVTRTSAWFSVSNVWVFQSHFRKKPSTLTVCLMQKCGISVPYQPLNLHAESISPNEILVKWDAPQEADSIISYELYYNDSHTRQNVRVSIHPPVNNYRLDDLTPDTVYHIQVSAKSARGEGPKTPLIQARTHQFSKCCPASSCLSSSWLLPFSGLLCQLVRCPFCLVFNCSIL